MSCYLYRGFAYKVLKQYDKALSDFTTIIKLDSKEPAGYANRASVYYLTMDYENSLKDFMQAYLIDTTKTRYFNPISHMLFATGQQEKACEFHKRAMAVGDTGFDIRISDYCKQR